MYPFSLIDPKTLLLVSIGVFSLMAVFMTLAGRIRQERAYLWLAVGAAAFAGGWSLNLAANVYGNTLLTRATAEILLLLMPVFLLCATLELLRLHGVHLVLTAAAAVLAFVFWLLVTFVDDEAVPGTMTSSLNGACYLATARIFYRHAYPHNPIGRLIIGAIVVIGTAFMLRTVFLMYGTVLPLNLSAEVHGQIIYTMLLVDLLGIFLLALCYPLFDFLRTEERLSVANQRLTQLSEYDSLTGIYNRRVFLERLREAVERHRESYAPLSLILFDMDHFKQVNDTYGHAVGDQVLCHAVNSAQTALREGDVLARFGGEEFTLLLPETPLSAAVRIAERIRKVLEESPTRAHAVPPPRVTASFGVTAAVGPSESVEDLLYAADDAVYAAKREGRNRVCIRATRSGEAHRHGAPASPATGPRPVDLDSTAL